MLVCVCVQVVEMNEALLANNVKASVRASPEEGEQERERERETGEVRWRERKREGKYKIFQLASTYNMG